MDAEMTDSEANELRLVANEIMRKLYISGQREQLNLLLKYAVSAIDNIDSQRGEVPRE